MRLIIRRKKPAKGLIISPNLPRPNPIRRFRMVEQEIERKIEDFKSLGIPRYIPRDGRLRLVDNMVSTVIGVRRAGKSFRALQAADEMIRQKVVRSIDQVCLIDFDNPVLSNMKPPDLPLIQNT